MQFFYILLIGKLFLKNQRIKLLKKNLMKILIKIAIVGNYFFKP